MNKAAFFEKVKEYKLLAKKEVGQNFLIDPQVAEATVNALQIQAGERILEIGPGAGSLSVFIADYPNEADLVDIDEALITKLSGDFEGNKQIHPIKGNAIKHDLSSYEKIIGNLPYYITSSLIEHALLDAPRCSRAVFMVQKEAFARLVAKQGSEDYGPLPILMKYLGIAKKELAVPRSAFVPAPHVDSVVFSFTFNAGVDREKAKRIYAFVSQLFLHRRKTILNNLSSYLKDPDSAKEALAQAGIRPETRPESISVEEFVALFGVVKK